MPAANYPQLTLIVEPINQEKEMMERWEPAPLLKGKCERKGGEWDHSLAEQTVWIRR